MNRVNLIIRYNTFQGKKVSDFMTGLDLGVAEIEPDPIHITYLTKTKIDKKYKEKIKGQLKDKLKNDFLIKEIEIKNYGKNRRRIT